jgi:SAM-dependent methyltransferase
VSENLVRDIHDAVAGSKSPVQASVRPPGTTRRELDAMRRDVLRKLRLGPGMSVAEIGCGVGLLGVPVAQRAGRYLGLDFAPEAVRVANERLGATGEDDRAGALCVDVLSLARDDLHRLGRFDRVLMYAVLHYARSEQEGALFLQRAVDLLAPGGRALVGNVPLGDLQVDWRSDGSSPRGLPARLIAAGRWMTTPGVAPVPLTRHWKALYTIKATRKRGSRSSAERFAPARLPADYTLALTTSTVEGWLARLEGEVSYHWELPSPGVPLAPGRADLILLRR